MKSQITTTSKHFFWIVFATLLVACSPGVTTLAPTQVDANAISTQAAATVITQMTHSAAVRLSTPVTPTAVVIQTAEPTLLPLFRLNNLRMAYTVNGNLYVQNGSDSPIQLTNQGEDRDPIFSDDGKKIIAYRGKINDNNNVYAVNSDESHEQALITNEWLAAIAPGTNAGPLSFVPGTHRLLFNSYLCAERDLSSGCTTGLFLADADTGTIKALLAPKQGGYLPFGGGAPWHGNFQVSPDGKLLAVASEGKVDILSIDGKIVRRNIITYTRSTPIELFPREYWLPDSRGLIIAVPTEKNYGGGYEMQPAYTVWRYGFDGSAAIQVSLDPPPMWLHMECGDVLRSSPNRNWAVYNRLDESFQLYVGNLSNGQTQSHSLDSDCLQVDWSADNTHFVFGHLNTNFLGTIGKQLIPISGNFLGWVDATHYMFLAPEDNILVGEIANEEIKSYDPGISLPKGFYRYSLTFVILADKAER